ncbi:hypothetical protein [Clostridium aminobutyricum]|uniref:DUF6382 domain-containing protein n=1 Tax=Clostridium aminobutyricum TaxID=33953 RepID=A0A939D7T9_CLOAM|nr:hypothetical protein [Clostridium aminobutyricum]MBN7772672.1 hypothetical protein [Clostridium aminobutyricum]
MEKIFVKNRIKNFEIKIFSEGQCSAFLPMSFIEKEDKWYVTYFSEDYIPMVHLNLNNPYELLHMIEKLLLSIKDAENHLILFNRYTLLKEEIFFSKKFDQVRLMFDPVVDDQEMEAFSAKMVNILIEIKKLVLEKRACEYLEMIIYKLDYSNISREGLINYIGELKREVHICGW